MHRLVTGCLIWFLWRVEYYVVCLGILTYHEYSFRLLSKVILGLIFMMHVFWFFIHITIIWICMSRVWPLFCGKNFKVGHNTQTVQPIFFCTFHAYRHHWLLPFYTTFTDLELDLGAQGQHKAKPIGFIFSNTFLSDQDAIWCGDKQFKLLRLLCKRFLETKEITAVLQTVEKL